MDKIIWSLVASFLTAISFSEPGYSLQCMCKERSDSGKCESCPPGCYGEHCELSCPSRCTSCTETNCITCEARFYGPTCTHYCPTTCKHCFYTISYEKCPLDKDCEQDCTRNCTVYGCEPETEICSRCAGACEPLVSRNKCRACKTGFWGNNCSSPCPTHCDGAICNEDTGHCPACVDGWFGENCNQTCPDRCYGNVCHKKTGECIRCNTGPCETGFAHVCEERCSHCHTTAECYLCKGRKGGRTCDDDCPENCKTCLSMTACSECDVGYFGPTCQSRCVQCKEGTSCHVKTGICDVACMDGYGGTYCNETCHKNCKACKRNNTSSCYQCSDGHFLTQDDICARCSNKCISDLCNISNGMCLHGCQPGYWGKFCNQSCDTCNECDRDSGECTSCMDGMYSKDCSVNCSKGCQTNDNGTLVCDFLSGNCHHGCQKGNYGDNCDKLCIARCRDAECDRTTGLCAGDTGSINADSSQRGIVIGVSSTIVLLVAVAGVVIAVIRGRRHLDMVTIRRVIYENTRLGARPPEPAPSELPDHSPIDGDDVMEMDYSRVNHEEILAEDLESVAGAVGTVSDLGDPGMSGAESEDIYYNNTTELMKLRIPIDKLVEFVSNKDDKYFENEFERLPKGLVKPYAESQKPGNSKRNRYKGVYPYDDSRVKLKRSEVDYINASYIDGYRCRRQYIACLGPTRQTLGDFTAFWTMVWQQRAEKIVMLTNLIENDSPKCDQYWPELTTTIKCGRIKIECSTEQVFTDFVMRSLVLRKGSRQMYVYHFHFTSWPDKGIPDDVTSLAEFKHKVVTTACKYNGPLIVHCSAGIGRTGTFIGLDILTREGETENTVDIYGCVRNMRQCRTSMVQTADQYRFLHTAVVQTLSWGIRPVPAEVFVAQYEMEGSFENRQLQFRYLQEALPRNKTLSLTTSARAESAKRISPLFDYQPARLQSEWEDGIYVKSYLYKNRYLLLEDPTADVAAEYLQRIVTENIACIVSLDTDEPDRFSLFNGERTSYEADGFFMSVTDSSVHRDHYQQHTLAIRHQDLYMNACNVGDSSEGQHIKIVKYLVFTGWRSRDSVPESPEVFLRFVQEVLSTTETTAESGPVLVLCRDGGCRAGLFCVMANLLEKLEIEHDVSVTSTVRKVQVKCHQAIPDMEQFEFCHQCVAAHLSVTGLYCNVR